MLTLFPYLEHHDAQGSSDDIECLEYAGHWENKDENIVFILK